MYVHNYVCMYRIAGMFSSGNFGRIIRDLPNLSLYNKFINGILNGRNLFLQSFLPTSVIMHVTPPFLCKWLHYIYSSTYCFQLWVPIMMCLTFLTHLYQQRKGAVFRRIYIRSK